MSTGDQVNAPAHYTSHPSGIEVIELTRHMPFGPGNALKYVLRRDHKDDPVTNLLKAEFYLNDSIRHGITYPVHEVMAQRAANMIDAEPNGYVQKIVFHLCIGHVFSSGVVDAPSYHEAKNNLLRLLRCYK